MPFRGKPANIPLREEKGEVGRRLTGIRKEAQKTVTSQILLMDGAEGNDGD